MTNHLPPECANQCGVRIIGPHQQSNGTLVRYWTADMQELCHNCGTRQPNRRYEHTLTPEIGDEGGAWWLNNTLYMWFEYDPPRGWHAMGAGEGGWHDTLMPTITAPPGEAFMHCSLVEGFAYLGQPNCAVPLRWRQLE